MTVRALGEFRGRQDLYRDQFPEVLETLKKVAMIQSVESSNRIEGITVVPERLNAIVAKKTTPKGHSEQEVAGYRDVLSEIHTSAQNLKLSPELILRWHKNMYKYTAEEAGIWKKEDNAILEILPDETRRVRFQPLAAAATPKRDQSTVQGVRRLHCTGYRRAAPCHRVVRDRFRVRSSVPGRKWKNRPAAHFALALSCRV